MNKIKVMSVFGTRPEAIKMAPLVLELRRRPEIESICCLTAQHREMLDSVMNVFNISAQYDLDIMEKNQTLYTITSKVLTGLGDLLAQAAPDLVLVHGDTSTTFSGALAAFYAKIKVGHVEAGLRSGDKFSPYPEEINRKLTGQIADLHFAPTAANAQNLIRENIEDGVFITGNTVIDAMRYTVTGEGALAVPGLASLQFANKRIITMTCHRRENYGDPMENIMTATRDLVRAFDDVELVYPVHLSPIVQETARRILGDEPRVHLIPPLDTVEMHRLMAASYLVMTDSGGIQEEAPALGKPVLVLRRETERPEAITAGTARLAGVERETIFDMAHELLTDAAAYDKMAKAVNPYGDGKASRRIADAILYHFGASAHEPEPFFPRN